MWCPRSYSSVGLCRGLVVAQDKNLEENASTWQYLQSMTVAVQTKVRALGLETYSEAREACAALKEALGVTRYGLSDLVMYVCLRG